MYSANLVFLESSLSSLASMKTEKLGLDRWKNEEASDGPYSKLASSLGSMRLDTTSGSGAQRADNTDSRSVQASQGSAKAGK